MQKRKGTARSSGNPVPYLEHIHNFRGLAIMLIVATHCVSVFDWSGNPRLGDVLARIIANGTIFYLFIAGYLFQHLSGRYRPRDYFRKKCRYVVLPYLIASIPALVLFTAFARRPEAPPGFYERTVWEQVIWFLGTGAHLAPFWYIPTLVLFYLASPVLYWLDRQRWFYWTLPPLLVIPVVVSAGTLNPPQAFVHYLPVWVLGMACSRHREKVQRWLSHGYWPLLAMAILLFIAELTLARGRYSAYSTAGKVVLAIWLCEGFRRWSGRASRWFALAGTLSFGIYFIHSYIISGAKLALHSLLGAPPVGGILPFALAAAIAIAVNVGVVDLAVGALGRYSRMVIGVDPSQGRRAVEARGKIDASDRAAFAAR